MRPLPLVPDGCTLSTTGLVQQLERGAQLRADVAGVARSASELHVEFGPAVDEALVARLIETERACCSFFRIDYVDRRLRIAVDDPRRRDALDAVTTFFSEEAA